MILEFGHTSTLRDAVDASVPGAATHDWEVSLENFRFRVGHLTIVDTIQALDGIKVYLSNFDDVSLQVWVKNPSNDKIENFLEKVFGKSLSIHG